MLAERRSTRTMKISEVKNTPSSLVNKVYREEIRVLVEKSGLPVAPSFRRTTSPGWEEGKKALERFSQGSRMSRLKS